MTQINLEKLRDLYSSKVGNLNSVSFLIYSYRNVQRLYYCFFGDSFTIGFYLEFNEFAVAQIFHLRKDQAKEKTSEAIKRLQLS